ncbi:MAG: hypothetical protein O2968_21945 [Acidobacteria bacterium]|nr:hypothetical protein [Acidobacteriota bacterium]
MISSRLCRSRALVSIVLLGLIAFWSCASWKTVENARPSDPFERVELTVGTDVDHLREVLLGLSEGRHHSEEIVAGVPDLNAFLIMGADSGFFPDDGSLRVNLDRSPWIEPYLDLGVDERANDLYVFSVMYLFWASDYVYEGAPAKFYTDFLLHLEAVSDSVTRVEVHEYLPRIWVGKSFQLGAHGPCMCRDQRWVEQTKTDRVALSIFQSKNDPEMR